MLEHIDNNPRAAWEAEVRRRDRQTDELVALARTFTTVSPEQVAQGTHTPASDRTTRIDPETLPEGVRLPNRAPRKMEGRPLSRNALLRAEMRAVCDAVNEEIREAGMVNSQGVPDLQVNGNRWMSERHLDGQTLKVQEPSGELDIELDEHFARFISVDMTNRSREEIVEDIADGIVTVASYEHQPNTWIEKWTDMFDKDVSEWVKRRAEGPKTDGLKSRLVDAAAEAEGDGKFFWFRDAGLRMTLEAWDNNVCCKLLACEWIPTGHKLISGPLTLAGKTYTSLKFWRQPGPWDDTIDALTASVVHWTKTGGYDIDLNKLAFNVTTAAQAALVAGSHTLDTATGFE